MTENINLRIAELADYPNHWLLSEEPDGESADGWVVLRKPDGTFWQVTGIDLFPKTGGVMRVNTGDQIIESGLLSGLESMYQRGRQRIEEGIMTMRIEKIGGDNYHVTVSDSQYKMDEGVNGSQLLGLLHRVQLVGTNPEDVLAMLDEHEPSFEMFVDFAASRAI